MKYYMKELNTYFKQSKVSNKTFIIVTGRDTIIMKINNIFIFSISTHCIYYELKSSI